MEDQYSWTKIQLSDTILKQNNWKLKYLCQSYQNKIFTPGWIQARQSVTTVDHETNFSVYFYIIRDFSI